MNYIIFWQPNKESDMLLQCPFIDIINATDELATPEWENGYSWLEQELSNEEFSIVDNASNNHVCIDVKPSPFPTGSPTGR